MERFMDFTFVAAQKLPGVSAGHPAARLHGHTFRLRVSVDGPVDAGAGWLMDPAVMKARVEDVLGQVDHRYLNEVEGLDNPSTENLCRWLKSRLTPDLPGVIRVELWENRDVGCIAGGVK